MLDFTIPPEIEALRARVAAFARDVLKEAGERARRRTAEDAEEGEQR